MERGGLSPAAPSPPAPHTAPAAGPAQAGRWTELSYDEAMRRAMAGAVRAARDLHLIYTWFTPDLHLIST